jgi:hypothetical protein
VALKVVVFNSAKSLQDVTLRVWELENGTYEVSEGTDVNGDDQIDVVTTNRTLPLKRHSAIASHCAHAEPPSSTLNKPERVRLCGSLPIWPSVLKKQQTRRKLTLMIHNIGGRKSPPSNDCRERKRTPLSRRTPWFRAQTDLKTETVTVELPTARRGAKSVVIKVDLANT